MSHALRIRLNALVLVAVLLVGLLAVSWPGSPATPSGSSVSAVKQPPIKPCRWMWFGNWYLCIRVP